ncbi:hypothetical protein JCM24511_09383 [Saitozyma sp. JCM 24511]|nr:hypothetical protein JCM24511_09383 [Saitozyma sp. JCM 24511]
MPDSFFQSDKKRKRPSRPGSTPGSGPSKQPYEKPYRPAAYGKGQKPKGRSSRQSARDEDLSSDAEGEGGGVDLDDMDFRRGRNDDAMSDGGLIDEIETAAEKRVRLAKGYLAKVREEVAAAQDDADYDAAEIDRELIASRLQHDVAEAEGRIHTYLASHLAEPVTHFITMPSQLPTSVALTPSSLWVSTKRGTISRYSLPSLRKVGKPFGQARAGPSMTEVEGHRGEILCLAASEDGRWLVSGGRDKAIGVWDVSGDQPAWKAGMRGHKDAVTSVALPPLNNQSHHVLSASLSRHLALHSLATLSVIDTFFGHQDSITSVSSLKPTIAVTAGSRDRTCRWWKVEEEVQLVFRGGGKSFERDGTSAETSGAVEEAPNKASRKGKGREFIEGSIDCVCMLDDEHFVSGGDSGTIALWHTGKKKPIFSISFAHGTQALPSDDQQLSGARWITSLAALRGTDLFASGSWDGQIRLWALDPSLRSFSLVKTIPVDGFVNGISLLALPEASVDSSKWPSDRPPTPQSPTLAPTDGVRGQREKQEIMLIAAVAREPRLGRWMRSEEGVRNGVFVAHLKLDEQGKAMTA